MLPMTSRSAWLTPEASENQRCSASFRTLTPGQPESCPPRAARRIREHLAPPAGRRGFCRLLAAQFSQFAWKKPF